MYCYKCGSKIIKAAHFCTECGESVSEFNSNPEDVAAVDSTPRQKAPVENQKDVLASEIITNLKLTGLSLVIAVISIFIIREMNNDNLDGIVPGNDRDLVIRANQSESVSKNVPRVFFYSLIGLVFGRYIILSIGWADKRTKEKANKNEINQ